MENNLKYIVYQTINIENNKIYIGYHGTKDPNKFDGYIGNGVNINYPSTYMNPKYPFQYAVKKYGTSKFRRSVLYIFDTEKEALLKEEELVNEEFIKRSDTYNVAIGGQKRPFIPNYNKIYQFDLDGNLLKEWNNIYEVSDFLETWKESIYCAIRNKSRLYNYYWSFNNNINIKEFSNPNNSRKVYQYNIDGKCIAIYDSIGQCSKMLNMNHNHVMKNIREGSLTLNNFYLSYELYDKYIKKPRLDLKNKILYIYTLEGDFIKKCTTEEFKKEHNLNRYYHISIAIENNKPIEGVLLKLEYFEKIDAYVPKTKKRPVVVYTKTGEFVKEFDSIAAACKEFGFDSSTVNKILRGCGKSTKGYTIKYKN